MTTNNEIHLTPDLLQDITKGEWVNYNPNLRYKGVGTHGILSDDYLSFAIALNEWRKKRVDIEQELLKIFKKGASTIVVDRTIYTKFFSQPMLVVDDVNESIKNVAIEIRKIVDPKRVLIAGSVGKTGLKITLDHLLNKEIKTHAVHNSANVKLPILYSLLSLQSNDQVELVEVSGAASFEVGVERSNIVHPHIVIFTNISPNHMRVHKSIENFLKAKASAVVGMVENGACIVNRDTEYCEQLIDIIKYLRADINISTFGRKTGDGHVISQSFDDNLFGWNVEASIENEAFQYFVPLFQHHAPVQSVAALLLAHQLGLNIQNILSAYDSFLCYETMGRIFKIQSKTKIFYYYDQSLRGALDGIKSALLDLKNFPKKNRIVAVIGGSSTEVDNEFTKQQHKALARYMNDSNIDLLYTVGPFMQYCHDDLNSDLKEKLIMHSDDLDLIFGDISSKLRSDDIIFVMGSSYLKLAQLSSKIFSLGQRTQIK